METALLSSQVLDEDLQIVRGTLAAIKPDVRRVSRRAAFAVQEAMKKLDVARKEFARARPARQASPPTGPRCSAAG